MTANNKPAKAKTPKKTGRIPCENPHKAVPLLDRYKGGAGTVTDLCKLLGVSSGVFYKWMGESEAFFQAVMRVRDRVDDEVESAFLKRAKGYTAKISDQRYDKEAGVVDLVKEVHVPGETGAAFNWLTNRRPEKWRKEKTVKVELDYQTILQEYIDEEEAKSGQS